MILPSVVNCFTPQTSVLGRQSSINSLFVGLPSPRPCKTEVIRRVSMSPRSHATFRVPDGSFELHQHLALSATTLVAQILVAWCADAHLMNHLGHADVIVGDGSRRSCCQMASPDTGSGAGHAHPILSGTDPSLAQSAAHSAPICGLKRREYHYRRMRSVLPFRAGG